MPLLKRLDLICTGCARLRILAEGAGRCVREHLYPEREIGADQTISTTCVPVPAGFAELLFELPKMFCEPGAVASGRQLARRPLGKLAERSGCRAIICQFPLPFFQKSTK